MPRHEEDSIRDKRGRRVAVDDCRLESLNFLLPGRAPILVPKRSAWHSPSQQAKDAGSKRGSSKKDIQVQVAQYEADDDDSSDYDYDTDEDDIKPLIKKKAKVAAKVPPKISKSDKAEKCKKGSVVKDKLREAKHSRRAERHQQRAERERQEAEEEREKLQRRIEKQETYIAKLKARYGARDSTASAAAEKKKKEKEVKPERKKEVKSEKKKDAKPEKEKDAKPKKKVTFKEDKPSTKSTKVTKSSLKKNTTPAKQADDTDDEGATTDGSTAAAVRDMLERMKIRAGGGGGHGGPPGNDPPWNDSDNSRLMALKADGETWNNIATALNRRSQGEVKRQHKHLKDTGWEAPGANEMTDAEVAEANKTGEETTDAEATTGAETTDAEATGAEETTDAEPTTGAETTEAEATGAEETTDAEATGAETTDAEATGAETTDAEATGVEETTDAEATGVEETTDAEATAAETTDAEAPAPPTPAAFEWNDATDNQLWKLKHEESKTWNQIHAEMGGSKSGIQNRYKTLVANNFQPSSSATADNDNPAAAAAGPPADTEEEAYVEKHKRAASKAASSKGKGNDSPTADPVQGYPGAGNAAYIESYSRNLLAAVSAGRARVPEPDEVFDESDCLLLALAESRRRKNRWLEIQADFANVTGRLVPVEILKWKLAGRDDDDEE